MHRNVKIRPGMTRFINIIFTKYQTLISINMNSTGANFKNSLKSTIFANSKVFEIVSLLELSFKFFLLKPQNEYYRLYSEISPWAYF